MQVSWFLVSPRNLRPSAFHRLHTNASHLSSCLPWMNTNDHLRRPLCSDLVFSQQWGQSLPHSAAGIWSLAAGSTARDLELLRGAVPGIPCLCQVAQQSHVHRSKALQLPSMGAEHLWDTWSWGCSSPDCPRLPALTEGRVQDLLCVTSSRARVMLLVLALFSGRIGCCNDILTAEDWHCGSDPLP